MKTIIGDLIKSDKRGENEDFGKYKKRLKEQRELLDAYLTGIYRVFWNNKGHGTYRRPE